MKGPVVILVAVVIAGAIGFLAGRQFPAHHWVKYLNVYLMDETTGRVCTTVPGYGLNYPTCGQ